MTTELPAMAAAITAALEQSEMTETELAAKIGVSESTIRRYIRGDTEPGRAKVALIARATRRPLASFPNGGRRNRGTGA